MAPISLLLLALGAPATAGELSLNAASAEQLSALQDVDPSEAERIVALRQERGSLSSVEALRVLGLDEPTLDSLRSGTWVNMSLQKVDNGKRYASAAEVLAEFANEPSIQDVHDWSMSYTRTNPEMVEGWMRASRNAYLLPKVNLKYKKDLDFSDTNRYEEELDDPGVYSAYDYSDAYGNDDEYEVKLEWRLDKLIISSERIRVINEGQDVVKLRDKVLDEVTRIYFDRRRLQVELLLNPPTNLREQIKDELRLQELSAGIDAYTGGRFSAGLPKG